MVLWIERAARARPTPARAPVGIYIMTHGFLFFCFGRGVAANFGVIIRSVIVVVVVWVFYGTGLACYCYATCYIASRQYYIIYLYTNTLGVCVCNRVRLLKRGPLQLRLPLYNPYYYYCFYISELHWLHAITATVDNFNSSCCCCC